MSEQEKKSLWENNSTTIDEEYNQSDLNTAVRELKKLEVRIFQGDGNIGWESKDTIIDAKYEAAMEKAGDLKTKIDMVWQLVEYFSTQLNYSSFDDKYISNESKKTIEKINTEFKKVSAKYPEYQEIIGNYIQNEIENGGYTQHFLIKDFKTHQNFKESDIKVFTQAFIDNILNYHIPNMVEFIEYTEKNDKIISKVPFVEMCLKGTIWVDGKRFDTLLNLDFYADNTTYQYGHNLNHEFKAEHVNDTKNLVWLVQLGEEPLNKVNSLYLNAKKDPNNIQALVDYIDTFSVNEKNQLLNIKNIRNLYVENKKDLLCIRPDLIQNSELIIAISNIKDKKTSEILFHLTKDILSNKGGEVKILSQFIQNQYGNLLYHASVTDKYYLSVFTEQMALTIAEYDNPWYQQLIESIDESRKNVESQLTDYIIDTISKKIETDSLLPDEYNKLQSMGLIDEDATGKIRINPTLISKQDVVKGKLGDSKLIEKVASVEALFSSSSVSPTPEKKQIWEIQDTKKLEKNSETAKKAKELFGNQVEINEKWQMVSNKWETTFTTQIWNRTLEVWEDGKVIMHGAMWYKFKYDNDEHGIEKLLQIWWQIKFVDDLWFGYFGESFKSMIETLNASTHLTGLRYLHINDSGKNADTFLTQVELSELTKAFHKLWFLESSSQHYGFQQEPMTKAKFDHTMQQNFSGKNFLLWGFQETQFKQNIRQVDWTQTA